MANIIVTGGFGTLGRAICDELRSAGNRAYAIDIAPRPSGFAAPASGEVDLNDEAQVAAAFTRAAEELGGIDALVNAAGGFVWESMADGSIASWDRMFAMNLRSAAIASRAALAYLPAGGAIVNIGAAAASNAAMGMAPYAASKAGVMALTESLADELRHRHIRVNAVLPTILDTPVNRKDMPDADYSGWIAPASAAKVISFLMSDDARNVTGIGIKLSAGG